KCDARCQSQGTRTKEHGLETSLAIVEQASFVVDGQIQNEDKKMVSNLMRERNRKKKLQTQEPLVKSPTSSEEETSTLVSIPTAPNSFCDSKVICPDNSPKANDYDDPMPSSMKKGTN
ncbi:9516_t:CDS:2, partial [Gigaspora margarita]